jgi:endonuclease VIII
MHGRWRVGRRGRVANGLPWLVLRSGEHEAVLWHGPVLELVRDGAHATRRLGPDVLAEPPDFDGMLERLRATDQQREVGDVLVDQHLVAGIGNMWKAEALWQARVSPWRTLAETSDDELRAALVVARDSMRARMNGARVAHGAYRRASRPCPRCGVAIRSHPQGETARLTYWCPGCQPGGRVPAG